MFTYWKNVFFFISLIWMQSYLGLKNHSSTFLITLPLVSYEFLLWQRFMEEFDLSFPHSFYAYYTV